MTNTTSAGSSLPGAKNVLLKFYSEMLEQDVRENVIAFPLNEVLNHYEVGSIPLYSNDIARGDTIVAEYDDNEECLVCLDVVSRSGNSVVWVVITEDEVDIRTVMNEFVRLGCDSRNSGDRFFALEIRKNQDYFKIKDHLNILRSGGSIDYAEANISEQHRL